MKKLVVLLLLLGFLATLFSAIVSEAEAEAAKDRDDVFAVTYSGVAKRTIDKGVEKVQIAKALVGLGYKEASDKLSIGSAVSGADMILADEGMAKIITVRFDLVPTGKTKLGEILGNKAGHFLFHGKTRGGSHVSLHFTGFAKAELAPVLQRVQAGK